MSSDPTERITEALGVASIDPELRPQNLKEYRNPAVFLMVYIALVAELVYAHG
jgi:hypothetical protein